MKFPVKLQNTLMRERFWHGDFNARFNEEKLEYKRVAFERILGI